MQPTSENIKQVNAHAAGGRISGSASQGLLLDDFVVRVSDADMEMSKWIDHLVMRNMPISIVDCPHTRRITILKAVSSKSVRKHILYLVMLARQQVRLRLPGKFALIFDGWTEGTDHYIGIWVSYNAIDNGNKDDFEQG